MTDEDEDVGQDDEGECKRCGSLMSIPFGLELTDYCNVCTQDLVKEFQKVLEWYANPQNYTSVGRESGCSPIHSDYGARARKALGR